MQKKNDMKLSAIVAIDEKGGIGKNGGIPWKCSKDMKHFSSYTQGSTCVMGRKTFESIRKYNKRETEIDLLPNRKLIVLTSTPPPVGQKNKYKNLIFVNDLNELKSNIFQGFYGLDVCIMGGSSLYEEFAAYYDEVSITEFSHDYKCSTFVDVNKLKFNRDKVVDTLNCDVKTSDGVSGNISVYKIRDYIYSPPHDLQWVDRS